MCSRERVDLDHCPFPRRARRFAVAVRATALLRAKPPKGGDAELRGLRRQRSLCQPGRQRLETFRVVGGFLFRLVVSAEAPASLR
jgi:hypothetical protein